MGFINDQIVYPYYSTLFEERKIGGSINDHVLYYSTEFYEKNLVGLRTLNEKGKFLQLNVMGPHLGVDDILMCERIIPALYG
jgi:hypothetical protein